MTWQEYGQEFEENISDLNGRIHRGGYRAKPTRRAYIPKSDGSQRALGIASLEDKIVQACVCEVLNTIYEEDFRGFSYGFRKGRSQHDALDALATGILRKKVNWVLDADVKGYFDAINHDRLMEMLEHRIGDKRVLRLIRKWLNAGVLEDGRTLEQEKGTPQGATISPLLANIYLHYVFDCWAREWRQMHAHGDVIVVRYADDFVMGFQHRHEAERFLKDLRERFAQFDLELHPDKTRLIEFGRFAEDDRNRGGRGKPETFDFLGFTHVCRRSRTGKFLLGRQTIAKRLRAKLHTVKLELRRRMHHRVGEVGHWLRSVLQGHYRYYGVPTNGRALRTFRREIARYWLQALRRRSQKGRNLTWASFSRLADRWLPQVPICEIFPEDRFAARQHSR